MRGAQHAIDASYRRGEPAGRIAGTDGRPGQTTGHSVVDKL